MPPKPKARGLVMHARDKKAQVEMALLGEGIRLMVTQQRVKGGIRQGRGWI